MRISDWSSAGCSSDLAGQLESADLDFARGLAFALYGHGIDEEFVMSRIENMRRQFHGHAIIDCFYAFPGRDGFEQKFGCVPAAQMIDWPPLINESLRRETHNDLNAALTGACPGLLEVPIRKPGRWLRSEEH